MVLVMEDMDIQVLVTLSTEDLFEGYDISYLLHSYDILKNF